MRRAHFGVRALLDIDMVCYSARLSQWGGGGYFTCSNDFYPPSRHLEGLWESAPCGLHKCNRKSLMNKPPLITERTGEVSGLNCGNKDDRGLVGSLNAAKKNRARAKV